jgi:hypothetical protein
MAAAAAAAAAHAHFQVIPSYPTTAGSDQQASGIAINTEKSDAMDAALQQLDIPGSCIVRQSTRCISGTVKRLYGKDMQVMSGGKWERKQQLERDAVELFLQQGKRGSATDEVLQQFRVQDGRRNADARHDLAVVFWLAAAALVQKAEQMRLQHKAQQSQAQRQQQAAAKQRRAAEMQQKQLDKLLRQQQQAGQAGQKRTTTEAFGRPGNVVLYLPVLSFPAAAMAAAAAVPAAAASYCAEEEKIDPTGLAAARWQLAAAAVKPEAAAEAVDLTQPDSPAAAGWASAAAAAAQGSQPPGAPRKRRRAVVVKPDPECIVLDD